MRRRALLFGLLLAGAARAQTGVWPEWLGSYAGALRFYRSIPLEDIYPPPKEPHVDADDSAPFSLYFAIRAEDDGLALWLRIDGGPRKPTIQLEELELDRREAAGDRAERFLLACGVSPGENAEIMRSARATATRTGNVVLKVHLGEGPRTSHPSYTRA